MIDPLSTLPSTATSPFNPGELVEFPEVIDSSIVASFMSCHRKGFWTSIRNIVPAETNVHLNAGGAYAKGLQTFRTEFYQHGATLEEARARGAVDLIKAYGPYEAPAQKSAKQWDNVLHAYLAYIDKYNPHFDPLRPYSVNGKSFIEFSFAIPLDIRHPVTGNPLIYGGRTDMIGVMYDTDLYVEDDKTTGQLGDKWADKWKLRGQFTGYAWAGHQYKHDVKGVIIRGVSIQKTQTKHIQCFEVRPQWMIDQWYEELIENIRWMIVCYERGWWPKTGQFNDFCSMFGGCQYRLLCTTPQPEQWIVANFQHHKWNPLAIVEDD